MQKGYIPNLAEARKPLQAKLRKQNGKDPVLNWTDKDTIFVEKLKKKFGNLPSLYSPNDEDIMILEIDASDELWEKNYRSNEKEYLTVKKAIGKFRIYLLPKEFTVRNDNKNFEYFLRTNITGDYNQDRLDNNGLNYYKFSVEHNVPGIKNSLADSLTRELSQVCLNQ